MGWSFTEINAEIVVQHFNCGNEGLNKFLKQYALQSMRQGFSSTYVAHEGNKEACGYYTISNAEITFRSLPPEKQKGIPQYPLSAMRLARLAVDIRSRGKGLGKELLRARAIITSRLGHRILGPPLNAARSQNPRHIDGYASDFVRSDRSNLTPICAPKREVIIARALRNACEIVLNQTKRIKAFALLVDAEDENAAAFYKHFGFIPYFDVPDSLYLPIKTLQKLVK